MFGKKIFLLSLISCILQVPYVRAASTFTDNVLTFLRLKKEYTPLLYFTVPKDEFLSSNKMDKIVAEVEKELKVKIQRFNVRKNIHHCSLRQLIGDNTGGAGGTSVPFLYHRESRQTIRGVATKEKVSAWAKGRWVESGLSLVGDDEEEKEQKEPPIEAMDMEDEDEDELGSGGFSMMEMKGKKAMREQAQEESQKQRQGK